VSSQSIGITMGDPSGIGPEIICKALAALPVDQRHSIVVFGNRQMLERADALVRSGLRFRGENMAIGDLAERDVRLRDLPVPDGRGPIRDGQIGAASGACAYSYIAAAVDAALDGRIGVIVTAPLNKAALHEAGYNFDGHTELLAHLTGAKSSFMLLASERLSTLHVSTHVSLAGAVKRASTQRVLDTIRQGHAHLRRLGIEQPRLAVAGLNPHSGEGGLFGREEIEHITPAIEFARAEGITVAGPIPGDTVFYRAMRGEFDLVIAQYHDQGHIPTKLIAFDETVNVTLGLPILRTSVDHGTAFDVAWKGVANHVNMLAAIAYGRRLITSEPPSVR
jgi:4-phospho-D-threonate 3-dehydrogenase / 4-phospho-D-erythronate 3-dehydrogenase